MGIEIPPLVTAPFRPDTLAIFKLNHTDGSDAKSLPGDVARDIANAILADQSGADHGEAAQGQQPTWLLPRAVRERTGTLLR